MTDLEALRAKCIATLDRHQRIALGVSGGKDSLAVLYLLRDQMHRVTAYHMDTGDLLPEVAETIEYVKAMCPNFVHIRGDVLGWHREHGLPSDIVADYRNFGLYCGTRCDGEMDISQAMGLFTTKLESAAFCMLQF